jgi:lipid II:glycine glycyltransferase (peptidoglycan interpeptide bridge formation enzyme)
MIAGVYVVWDARKMYYLIGGMDPAHKTTGAMSLLIWEALQMAADMGLQLDLEGSMQQSIARFFAGFGAKAQAYHKIYDYPSVMYRMYKALRP